jgi:hypothetical protein
MRMHSGRKNLSAFTDDSSPREKAGDHGVRTAVDTREGWTGMATRSTKSTSSPPILR